MNIILNEYSGFCFELNFELNHFLAKFNEKMNFQNVSFRAILAESALNGKNKRIDGEKCVRPKIYFETYSK